MDFAVIFDLDGVIVDNSQIHRQAWQLFCRRHGLVFSEERFRLEFFGQTNSQVLRLLFGSSVPNERVNRLAMEKEAIYREIFLPVMQAANGLVAFLDELYLHQVPVALATSAPPENVDFVLDNLGIRHFFGTIVDDTMVVKGKPSPEIYLNAAGQCKTNPSKCVVFEDSLSGTKSAYDAGTFVVGVTTTLAPEYHLYAHRLIADFSEINFEILKEIAACR